MNIKQIMKLLENPSVIGELHYRSIKLKFYRYYNLSGKIIPTLVNEFNKNKRNGCHVKIIYALNSLWYVNPLQIETLFLEHLKKNRNKEIKMAIIWCLKDKVNSKIIITLKKSLKQEKNKDIHYLILFIFKEMFNKATRDKNFPVQDILSILVEVIRDFHILEIRITAIKLIHRIGFKAREAIPALIDVLVNTEEEYKLRKISYNVLKSLITIDSIHRLLDYVNSDEENIRYWIILLIGEIGAREDLVILKSLLKKERSSKVRFGLAYALTKVEKMGEGIKEFQRLVEEGEITKNQYQKFKRLIRKLKLEKQVEELIDGFISVKETATSIRRKVENQPKSAEKEELLSFIKNQELIILNLQKTITHLIEELTQASKNRKKLESFAEKSADRPLSNFEKVELQRQFDSLSQIVDSKEKGKALEEFCQLFFSKASGFKIVETNANYANEEIDIMIQNSVNKSYWYHFSSPNIFVECKNWTEKVGKNEIVLFKNKIENHQNLVKIGFLIAMNGFTKGVTIEQIRNQLKGFTIGLIKKEDIIEFLKSNLTILEFLEMIIQKNSIA